MSIIKSLWFLTTTQKISFYKDIDMECVMRVYCCCSVSMLHVISPSTNSVSYLGIICGDLLRLWFSIFFHVLLHWNHSKKCCSCVWDLSLLIFSIMFKHCITSLFEFSIVQYQELWTSLSLITPYSSFRSQDRAQNNI